MSLRPESEYPASQSAAPGAGFPRLIDSHGRHIHKLRVQLTDACNFRCFYCMPENIKFLPPKDLLTPAEIADIVGGLVDHGIDEIRLTGGEPTLRRDFEAIVGGLSDLPLKKFGFTTNGLTLEPRLPFLQATTCRNINVSLDSLDPEKYFEITKRDGFEPVLSSIQKAAAMGFKVKVNTVMFRGINDSEIMDFIRFSAEHDVEVRFLEYMKIGPSQGQFTNYFISKREMTEIIERHESVELVPSPVDSTSVRYRTASGARIGFIASESEPFCGHCSRLRLTAKGVLRSCLMSENGLNLRGQPRAMYSEILEKVMAMKPYERIESIDQPMHQIGGDFRLMNQIHTFKALAVISAAMALGGCGESQDTAQSPAAPQIESVPQSWPATRPTDGGSFTVTLEPSGGTIERSRHFSLAVTVKPNDSAGSSPGKLKVVVDADMPAHRHGMNTLPVLVEKGKLQYQVDGMLFHMAGDWVINVDINHREISERAFFPVLVE